MASKSQCFICGRKATAAELMLASIFEMNWLEGGMCLDCGLRAHNKLHPGMTCCEAQLGQEEGCMNRGDCCGGKYMPEDEDQCDFCDSGRCQRCVKNSMLRNDYV